MKKRGQFYIIAAIIISIILLGLFAARNYILVGPKEVKFYDLSKELNLESGYVIDHGIYKDEDLDVLVDQWASAYVNYSSKVTEVGEWIFVYGDEEEIDAIVFTNEVSGTVSINIGTSSSNIKITGDAKKYKKENIAAEGNLVNLTTPDGDEYEFNLNRGENFFFVISKGEYVAIPGLSPTGAVIAGDTNNEK